MTKHLHFTTIFLGELTKNPSQPTADFFLASMKRSTECTCSPAWANNQSQVTYMAGDKHHSIGLSEKLQETMVFTIKYRAFL
jgi:hypothetical protein